MGWLDRVLTGWAELDPRDADAALHPVTLPITADEALVAIAAATQSLPRWEVVTVHEAARLVRATHTTRLGGFVQDVSIQVEAVPGGARMAARSQSRSGRADLGQNRRNLRELTVAVREATQPSRPEVVAPAMAGQEVR
jgi:uncharacterized protein (DUF1499 family)